MHERQRTPQPLPAHRVGRVDERPRVQRVASFSILNMTPTACRTNGRHTSAWKQSARRSCHWLPLLGFDEGYPAPSASTRKKIKRGPASQPSTSSDKVALEHHRAGRRLGISIHRVATPQANAGGFHAGHAGHTGRQVSAAWADDLAGRFRSGLGSRHLHRERAEPITQCRPDLLQE
jgi:hypothetical protein